MQRSSFKRVIPRLRGFRSFHPSHSRLSLTTDVRDECAAFGSYSVILPDEPFAWGVSHIKPRHVPPHIPRPLYARRYRSGQETEDADIQEPYEGNGRIQLHTEEETKLRESAQLASKVREYAKDLVRPGVTTNSVDEAIHRFILAHSAYPSPLHYAGFPRSCCTSINNIVSHGIPDDRPLEDGDILNVDVTVYLNGYHGDTSQTFLVGEVDEPGRALVEVTNAALETGIGACGPGRPFRDIGRAIHDLIQQTPGYSVCTSFAGHGIGKVFHRPPWIYHTLNEEPGTMLPGHCFTIEPCIVQGPDPRVWIFPDGWTASTENCARSAQAEHMILVTESGAEVLTRE